MSKVLKVKLYRMSAAGNLFTVIDNRDIKLDNIQGAQLAKVYCQLSEKNNFKAEGLMLLNNSNKFDFDVKFFNPDGSSGMMCGNGGRAIVYFAKELKLIEKTRHINFKMAGEIYFAEIENNLINLFLPPPIEIKPISTIEFDKISIPFQYINVGSDHIVINIMDLGIDDISQIDINEIAPKLRFNKIFMPRGVNVNFYQILNVNDLKLRTYERGVEAETGACGTGAISTALSYIKNFNGHFPVKISPTSNQELEVNLIGSLDSIEKITLRGNAEILKIDEVTIKI